MAEHDDGAPAELGTGKPKNALERKLGKHYPLVIVAISIVGITIAWLTFRRSQNNSTAAGLNPNAGATYTSGSGIGQPTGPGVSGGGSAAGGFAALLRNQTHLLQSIESTLQREQRPGHHVPGFDFASMNHSWAGEPVTAPARFLYGRAAKGLAYIRDRASGVVYQINPNGKRYALSSAQYAELGQPKATLFGRVRHPREQHNPAPGQPRRHRQPRPGAGGRVQHYPNPFPPAPPASPGGYVAAGPRRR